MLKEILTRAVIAKGKIEGEKEEIIELKNVASKLVGCWIINSNYLNVVENSKVHLEGSYDIHIWYAIDDDRDTVLEKKTVTYKEEFDFDDSFNVNECEYKLYSQEYPRCTNLDLSGNKAIVKVSKKFAIDAIGESKFMVEVNETFNEIKIDSEYLK